MISDTNQVLGAITTRNRPLTRDEIFKSCDCFAEEEAAAKLLNTMVKNDTLSAFRPFGEQIRYALPGMSHGTPVEVRFAAPKKDAPLRMKVEAVTGIDGIPPNAEEIVLARHLTPATATFHEFSNSHVSLADAAAGIEGLAIDKHFTRPDFIAREQAADDELTTAIALLRSHLSEAEFRGYCRGNLITLSLRGTPEDLQRVQVFGRALAGVL